jgi:NAD-dependent dihydropyrimidine dehydrogenase PreA subunit
VITIDVARCTGCGACIEICPTGALYLVEDKAVLDGTLCDACEACLDACASGAIALAPLPDPAGEPVAKASRLPAQRPEPGVIRVRTQSAPIPLRAKVLPVVGAALAWAGREIVPYVVDVLLDARDRRTTGKQMTARGRSNGAPSEGTGKRGQQRRHRRRGGK